MTPEWIEELRARIANLSWVGSWTDDVIRECLDEIERLQAAVPPEGSAVIPPDLVAASCERGAWSGDAADQLYAILQAAYGGAS